MESAAHVSEPPLALPASFQAAMVSEAAMATLSMSEMAVMSTPKLPELLQDEAAKCADMSFETPPKLPEMALEEPEKLPEDDESRGEGAAEKRKNLTDQQRVAIVHYLLANSAGGRLKHGDMKAAATHFGVHRATIRRLWKLHTASNTTEGLAGNVASRIKGHSGRKPKVPDEELKIRIAAIPAERRMTGRGLSTALGVSNSVVVRLIKSGKLRRHPKKLHYIM